MPDYQDAVRSETAIGPYIFFRNLLLALRTVSLQTWFLTHFLAIRFRRPFVLLVRRRTALFSPFRGRCIVYRRHVGFVASVELFRRGWCLNHRRWIRKLVLLVSSAPRPEHELKGHTLSSSSASACFGPRFAFGDAERLGPASACSSGSSCSLISKDQAINESLDAQDTSSRAP